MSAQRGAAATLGFLLALAFLVSSPMRASAQNPSEVQYTDLGTGDCPPNAGQCNGSLGDGAEAFGEISGQGTDAVNDAVSANAPSASAPSAVPSTFGQTPASPEGSDPPGHPNSPEGPTRASAVHTGARGGPSSITELPETSVPLPSKAEMLTS